MRRPRAPNIHVTSIRPVAANDAADNTITLSEAFYNEIDTHRIPIERGVTAALAHAPAILDFYIWLVWTSWAVNGSSAYIPLFTASGLCCNWARQSIPRGGFDSSSANGCAE